MPTSYRHVYLSPHFDDAALSCGGRIHQQVQAGESVLVVTVCGGAPDPDVPFSPFARELHQLWGVERGVTEVRRTEDREAMRRLGAAFVHLDVLDAIYRGRPERGIWWYQGAAVGGPLHRDDRAGLDRLAERLAALVPDSASCELHVPLGIGGHVDHRMVHEAGSMLMGASRRVSFFEDYPYVDPRHPAGADSPWTLDASVRAVPGTRLAPHLHPITEADLAARVSSVLAYGSQMEMLFEGTANAAPMIRAFAEETGRPAAIPLAERTWSAA